MNSEDRKFRDLLILVVDGAIERGDISQEDGEELKKRSFSMIGFGIHYYYLSETPPDSMLLGNGKVVRVGDRLVESRNGPGTVVGFYGANSIYCLDVEHDNGESRSYHPTMFSDQFKEEHKD